MDNLMLWLVIGVISAIIIMIILAIATRPESDEEINKRVEETWLYKRMYIDDDYKGIIQVHQESIDIFKELGKNIRFEDLKEEDYA